MPRYGENAFAGRRNSKYTGPEVAMTSDMVKEQEVSQHGKERGRHHKPGYTGGDLGQEFERFSKCYESSQKSSKWRDNMTLALGCHMKNEFRFWHFTQNRLRCDKQQGFFL